MLTLALLTVGATIVSSADEASAGRRRRRTATIASKPAAKPAPVPAPAPAPSLLLAEDFERLPEGSWADGSVNGQWLSRFNGYGANAVAATADRGKVLNLAPLASSSAGETHAGLVTSTTRMAGDQDINVALRTTSQLRTPAANAWETAWVLWNYTDEHHFYYLALKPNGYELAKEDPTVQVTNPALPADCAWPSYNNCKYPGAQRYLVTASSPAFPVGAWHNVRIVQRANTITVWANGQQLTTFVDADAPYTAGHVGLYTEDAAVSFSDVRVARP